MRETGSSSTEREAIHAQVERLIHSSMLHGSESLRKLLLYLSEQTLDHPGSSIKEYQIATDVFGRPSNFDPRLDSTVRVQTGRLRSKMAEYYGGPGAHDRLVIEVPKGSYALSYHFRSSTEEAPAAAAEPGDTTQARPFPMGWFLLSIVTGVLVAVVLGLTLARYRAPNARSAEEGAPEVLRDFWRGFIDTDDAPLVVYSNAEFVGRPETGIRYYDPARDRGQTTLDHYTGVGEVMGIHELDRVFTSFHHPIRLKRGRLLTWDDAKNSDLVFIGSPSENLSLRELPAAQDFIFKRLDSGPRKGDLCIFSTHPRAGEQTVYLASSVLPVAEDYAVVGLRPGLNPARWVLILAGITTFGTQAAVEFVCRPARIEELLLKLSGSRTGKVTPFEAVLRVKISGGVPVQSELLVVHPHGQ